VCYALVVNRERIMANRIASFARHNAVALLALFVALGSGSAVAATIINGTQIAANSMPENRLQTVAIADLKKLGPSVYSDSAAVTPPTGGTQFTVKQVVINTAQPGKLLILNALLEGTIYNNTSAAPVNYSTGVYVDNVPVPGTYLGGFVAPAHTSGSFASPNPVYGSLSNVGAGIHTVRIAVRTTNTAVNYITSGSGRLIVVATG
jgi:hypothetical protein